MKTIQEFTCPFILILLLISCNSQKRKIKTQLLLTNSIIRDTLLKYKTIRFTITNEDGLWNERPAEGKYMLYFVMETKITRKAQLQELLSLYKETIDYLSL